MPKKTGEMPASVGRVLDQLCSVDQAAEILGVCRRQAKRYCEDGRLAARRYGLTWIIWRPSAERLAQEDRPAGNPNWRKA